MKVLVVYHYIPSYRAAIFNELKGMAGGAEFHFASDEVANNDVALIDSSFYESSSFKRLTNVWSPLGLWQGGLVKLIIKERYDAIVFLGDPGFLSTWVASILLKFTRVKVLFWTHGFIRGNSIKDRLKLLFYRLSDALLLYGDAAKVNLIDRGVCEEKLFPIYNSLDYEIQKDIRGDITHEEVFDKKNAFFGGLTRFQIIFVGRLTKQKKINAVLDMIANLKKEGVLVNFIVVGDGEVRRELEELTLSLGVESQVEFYGRSYNENELAVLLMGSDVCVSPGEIGLTAMHMLAYGVPVITHNNEFTQMPEYEAVVNGHTGYLFKDGDYKEMTDLVKFMVKNPDYGMKKNCIDIIEEKYNPVTQKRLILEAINEVNGP